MNQEKRRLPIWFWVASVFVITFFAGVQCSFTAYYPVSADADAQGRLDTFHAWQTLGTPPPSSQGPLHFYLLKLFDRLGDKTIEENWPDRISSLLFLIFFLLFTAEMFGPWVALGSATALSVHPTILKHAVIASGFFPFFACIFCGFWLLIPLFRDDEESPKWRAFAGGLVLSASVFLRFEGLYFLAFTCFFLLLLKRIIPFLLFIIGTILIAMTVHFFTYLDLASFLQMSTLFIGSAAPEVNVQMDLFAGYLAAHYGVFPLLGGVVGAFIGLFDRSLRPWAAILLTYFLVTVATYAFGRFQYDLDRYYLFLLIGYLPFFGYLAHRMLPAKKTRLAAVTVLLSYAICAFFYAHASCRHAQLQKVKTADEAPIERVLSNE